MQGLRFRAICCASSLGLAAACAGSQDTPPNTLRFEKFAPVVTEGVFLNEPLTFHFGSDVDPLSVGRESVVIESAQGERARDSLSVEGRRVVFRPDVPRAQDLSDGGYRPATRYVVRLAGFPRPDGLRGVGGEPLAATWRGSFTTVAVDAPRRSRLFDDPHQERRKPPDLFPGAGQHYVVAAGDPLYIGSEKQIDPTSVRSGDFKLRRVRRSVTQSEQLLDVFVRLLENDPLARRERLRSFRTLYSDEQWLTERRAALLELTPVQRLESTETYELLYEPLESPAGEELWSLRDFSLGRLLPEPLTFKRRISVVSGTEAGTRGQSFVEDFVETGLRSPKFVPGCDGTAAWTGTGRVEVHYPFAAGDGSADAVALSGVESRRDLQATSLDLAAGATCTLPDAPGLVVLRAQGRISLQGILERRAPAAQPFDPGPSGTPLSLWLARAQAENPSWTVIIAGGDLVLAEGAEIRSSVPVLLVAGGQVRNLGPALSEERFWTQSGARDPQALLSKGEATFELDAPVGANPLRAPLRYAVVSGPVPETGGVLRWNSAYSRGGFVPPSSALPPPKPGRTPSSFSVHYFPADAPQMPDFSKAPTSPAFLPQPGPVRFVVELVIGDEKVWQAPFLDRVQLEYEQPR